MLKNQRATCHEFNFLPRTQQPTAEEAREGPTVGQDAVGRGFGKGLMSGATNMTKPTSPREPEWTCANSGSQT